MLNDQPEAQKLCEKLIKIKRKVRLEMMELFIDIMRFLMLYFSLKY